MLSGILQSKYGSLDCSEELSLLTQVIASRFMLSCFLLLSCYLININKRNSLGNDINGYILSKFSDAAVWLITFYAKIFNPKLEDALSCIEHHIVDTHPSESDVEGAPLSLNNILSMLTNAAVWLITFYTKIFNPKLENALFCIECGFHIVDTIPSELDVGRAPNKASKKTNVNDQLSFSNILSEFSSVVVWLNPNLENVSSFVGCRTGVTEENLLVSEVKRSAHKPPKESIIHQPPFTDVFLELLKAAAWLITKIIYDNLEYDNNVGLTESNVRGPNKPPKKSTNSHHQPLSDIKYFHESSGRSSRDYGTNDNCNHDLHHASATVSQMTIVPTVPVHPRDLLLKCKNFAGGDCDGDNSHVVPKSDLCNANPFQNDLVGANNCHSSSNQILAKNSISNSGTANSKTTTIYSMSTGQTLKRSPPLITGDSIMKMSVKSTPQETAENSLKISAYNECYKKLTYAVLVGNTVRTCNTKLYASLPLQNKYMVKQRVQDSSGATRIRLVLKSSHESCLEEAKQSETQVYCDDLETNENIQRTHYHRNCKKVGYIVYSCDGSFCGDIKYPLPSGKATNSKIGRGGNGFVFTIYHEKRQYAVKQTVHRSNEVNVHSALSHENVLPLLAVLMGEKHETHSGRLYCYHFMPKMDYDLRQILSIKEIVCDYDLRQFLPIEEVGCLSTVVISILKYLYENCPTKFDGAFNNVKFILKETLKALSYIHSSGFVHGDVKASNIMITMNCKCNPLYCDCILKFQVKLGDFDAAHTIPDLAMKEPTDQMIKFASILPLGTPGYRAPEVSMHIVLSGPYETLYTTAVDMWSFGCLCLNICIGKTEALKQREEALLLLSTHKRFEELWIKTSKIRELERTQPFSNDAKLLYLIQSCLRVDYNKRLSATVAQAYL